MDNARRTAGWAAIAAACLYILQPIIVALGGLAGAEQQEFLLPSQVRALWWSGAAQGLVLLGVGIALLVLVTGLGLTLRQATAPPSTLEQAAHTLGIVGAVGWLFAAATGIAGYSTVAAYMSQSGADEGAQKAALHMVNVILTAGLALSAAGISVWLVSFSVAALRAGLIGRALAAAGSVVAAVSAGTTLFGFPLGLLLLIPYLPFLGVRLLRGTAVTGGAKVSPAQGVSAA